MTDFNPRTSCEVRLCGCANSKQILYFNPRTSCEVRREIFDIDKGLYDISIHAPLARCDDHTVLQLCKYHDISIHAPLARCDRGPSVWHLAHNDFNPRTSCEVRLMQYEYRFRIKIFQSTHLLRGATSVLMELYCDTRISIHAPLARCDTAWE